MSYPCPWRLKFGRDVHLMLGQSYWQVFYLRLGYLFNARGEKVEVPQPNNGTHSGSENVARGALRPCAPSLPQCEPHFLCP